MSLAMAIANRSKGKQSQAKKRRQGPAARRAAKPKSGDDGERSSPAMAEVDAEVLEFIAAIDRFKQQHGRPFPSWSEILLVLRQLGYHRG